MTVKLLTEQHFEQHFEFLSLNRGCTDSSWTTLVIMLHCWNAHVVAQLIDIITAHHVVMRERNNDNFRPPDKSAYCKTISFISHPKHILNETVLLSTQTPKTHV